MDYTLMIICYVGASGYGMTSQLKAFPSKHLAEMTATAIEAQAKKLSHRVEVLRLYDKDAM